MQKKRVADHELGMMKTQLEQFQRENESLKRSHSIEAAANKKRSQANPVEQKQKPILSKW